MIKKVGQVIELDANKKYVMLIKADAMSENDVKLITDALTAQQNNLLTICLPELESIEFVENSDRIIDVVAKAK